MRGRWKILMRAVAGLVLVTLLALGFQTGTDAAFGADSDAQALVTHQDQVLGRTAVRQAAITLSDQGTARLHGKACCRTCSQLAIVADSSQMLAAAPLGASMLIPVEPASGQADPMGLRRPPRSSMTV